MTVAEHWINVKDQAETDGRLQKISCEKAKELVAKAEKELGNLTLEKAAKEWKD